MEKQFSLDLAGRKLILDIKAYAPQVNGSVLVTYGETVVLVTAAMSNTVREGIDYFPLLVDYDEKLYAAGRIKGSRFMKREGRPSDEAILSARMIDRSLRPRFNQDIRYDVQIVATILSFDKENDPDVPALIGSSVALSISDIPFNGPVAAVRIGKVNGKFIVNPTYKEFSQSDIDLTVAGDANLITMIECGSKETPEKDIIEAIDFGSKELKKIIDWQKEIIEFFKPVKKDILKKEKNTELQNTVVDFVKDNIEKYLYKPEFDLLSKTESLKFKEEFKKYIIEKRGPELLKEAEEIFEEVTAEIFFENIIKYEKRPDGRKLNEIRPLQAKVGILPRPHGSGYFQRGLTQALSVLTLGAPGDELYIEGMEIIGKSRFMHHYNFPPFAPGEIAPLRGPGRREIGHGALAEKALKPLIPNETEFPYTIRIVTEILSSNGSTSMASVCSSSLALMDAGVPIKRNIAGIAMGLVFKDENNYKILTDIQGPEDHYGHMDFKIAGTSKGVTAIQLDVKLPGVPLKILKEAIEKAKEARKQILSVMDNVISFPRENLSKYAPRVWAIKINPDKIREVIGSGGKTINEIISQTGVKIDIQDSGFIYITSENEESARKAKSIIELITKMPEVGQILKGKITGITDFGAFLEYAPGKEGLIHISELANKFVKNANDIVKIGQELEVKVIGVDEFSGKVQLSLKKLNNNYQNQPIWHR